MPTLHELGLRRGTDKATFHRYLDFYEDHLPGREFTGHLLEIGVMDGASIRMWEDYYPNAHITGVDIHDKTSMNINSTILKGDATDPGFVSGLGMFDIILDDGSHMTLDQQTSFKMLWPHLNPGGWYVMEDLHTSYMSNYHNADITTMAWIREVSDLDWMIHQTRQSTVDEFIKRHGFKLSDLTWSESDVYSITAMVRKK